MPPNPRNQPAEGTNIHKRPSNARGKRSEKSRTTARGTKAAATAECVRHSRKGEPPAERAQQTADCRSTRDERTKAKEPENTPKAPQPRRSAANTAARTQPRRRQTKRAAATKRKPKGETLARHAPIMTQQEPDVRLLGFIRNRFKTLKPILFRCAGVLLRWCIRLAT